MKRKQQTKKNKRTKQRGVSLQNIRNFIKRKLSSINPKTVNEAIALALKLAKKKKIKAPKRRVIKIPQRGGILPLVPIFAGLSALGALGGGAANVMRAINTAKTARRQLEEAKRHNETMESIAMGRGLYLKPYQKGLGIFL